LKAASLNIFRAAMVNIARKRAGMDNLLINCYLKPIIRIVKELFWFFDSYCCYQPNINQLKSIAGV